MSRLDDIVSKRIDGGTFISAPKRDPEPEGLTNLRNNLTNIFTQGLSSFNPNNLKQAQTITNNALAQQNTLLGQLTGNNGQLAKNNALADEIANIARTGNIPSGVSDRLNASVNRDLQNSMGNMLNSLASRGVLNSSVTTAGTNQLSQAAADSFNRNYLTAYQAALSGMGSALQGQQNNTSAMLSTLGALGTIPSQAYEAAYAGITPVYNYWKDWQNFYQNDDPYNDIYVQDPVKQSGGGGCITGDTLVTLADSREIPISELTQGDKIKTWDFETGCLTSAPLTVLYKNIVDDGADVIRVEFEDGSTVGVIYEHLFFDITEGKFIAINTDNQEYVGHEFAKVKNGKVTPVKVARIFKDGKAEEAFGTQCSGYLNYLAGGFITGNDGQLGLCNMFDFDTEKMTFDKTKKAADLEKYGRLNYADFEGIVSKEFFDNNHIEEFTVAFGKELMKVSYLKAYLKKFASCILE